MERARSELLNEAGIELARFVERPALVMVHDIDVKYHNLRGSTTFCR